MTKTEVKEVEDLFEVLKTGTKNQIQEAKKKIAKIWNRDPQAYRKKGKFILATIAEFDHIPDAVHKAAVISGMDLFCLALADDYFEELKDFLLKNLQDPDGRIREAARKVFRWLHISLSDRADPFLFRTTTLSEKQKVEQIKAKKQYHDLITELEAFIDIYNSPDKDADYIEDMKPSINKSLQMLWADLTDTPTYRKIVEETQPLTLEIFARRKEIEAELERLLGEREDFLDVNYLKQMIYTEDSMKDMHRIIALYTKECDEKDLDKMLQLVSAAWNYFPHKSLGGSCPAERISEFR